MMVYISIMSIERLNATWGEVNATWREKVAFSLAIVLPSRNNSVTMIINRGALNCHIFQTQTMEKVNAIEKSAI